MGKKDRGLGERPAPSVPMPAPPKERDEPAADPPPPLSPLPATPLCPHPGDAPTPPRRWRTWDDSSAAPLLGRSVTGAYFDRGDPE